VVDARQGAEQPGKRRGPFRWQALLIDACAAGITPDEFWSATPREISIRLKGALWREQQAARLVVSEAWHVASLMRAKRIPSLKVLLRGLDRAAARQSPETVRAAWLTWAAARGYKIQQHERPVV
jgi:hypothetical protein